MCVQKWMSWSCWSPCYSSGSFNFRSLRVDLIYNYLWIEEDGGPVLDHQNRHRFLIFFRLVVFYSSNKVFNKILRWKKSISIDKFWMWMRNMRNGGYFSEKKDEGRKIKIRCKRSKNEKFWKKGRKTESTLFW